jgi:uncharacterized membrane protein
MVKLRGIVMIAKIARTIMAEEPPIMAHFLLILNLVSVTIFFFVSFISSVSIIIHPCRIHLLVRKV